MEAGKERPAAAAAAAAAAAKRRISATFKHQHAGRVAARGIGAVAARSEDASDKNTQTQKESHSFVC